MSWFGDQLNSITGKISDFTKEVLIESEASKLTDEESNQNGVLPFKELADLCKEKDQKIEQLMQEKQSLEKSIDELDQQHREETSYLLQLKNGTVVENKLLKQRLAEQEAKLSSKPDFLCNNFDHLNKDLKVVLTSKMGFDSDIFDDKCSKENQNLLTLFRLLSNSCTEDGIKEGIQWLENQKHHINNYTSEDKDTLNNLISKTNTIASSNVAMQTDATIYICNNQDLNRTFSKHSQTENSLEIINVTHDNTELSKLQSTIDVLEQEKAQFQNEISALKSLVNKTSSSIFVQTSEYVCECESLKAKLEASKLELINLEQVSNAKLKEQLDRLNNVKEKMLLKESVITEKDAITKSQKREITSLLEKMKTMREDLNTLKKEYSSREFNSSQLSSEKFSSSNHVEKDNEHEIKHLLGKISSLELEKSKLLCVLNEKSQECSSLKTEVHKLTSIVASEKQALLKLQQDNCELKLSNKEKSDPELTKETVKKLSNLIRDKDLEIESLKQKNSTLTTLIQETSNIPEHLQSLLEEKENLSRQIKVFKTDREKFMVDYNMKDKELHKCTTEVKELNSELLEQREKVIVLEQTHNSLAQQYEEKQKSLINTQNEMINLKQYLTGLEQQLVDIKEKYSNLLNQVNSGDAIQITKNELNDKNTKIEQLTSANEEKDHLIQEKTV
ncbi:thyroid receptor-interacting protein 11 [Caerostris extrusa]|uniref:Thyroid receptor-interacting protein 11 n=1 Tax=Caerostris extrusa TaxID=172846 RepID=A0AAV4XPF7_CAEEX|nr:thyroid receptor-interacting protein 11 [Caerostris extrusa]